MDCDFHILHARKKHESYDSGPTFVSEVSIGNQ